MLSLVLALALARPTQAQPTDSLSAGSAAGVPVRVIRVDLTNSRVHVSVQTANGCPRAAESFESLLSRSKPAVAVNGSYFSKETLAPIGDIVVKGRVVHQGMMGTALAITADNHAIIRRVQWGHAEDWSDYETVLGCGPALVLNGKIDVNPEGETFHDPHIMSSARRMGVGITAEGKLLIVNTLSSVTFHKWAEVMYALGCRDAMNLDAGASLALHYRGRTLASPGRHLTNLLVVHVDPPSPSSPVTASK